MMTPIDVSLLDRYLANDCTPDERAAVAQWLADDPSRSLDLLPEYPPHLGDSEAASARIRSKVQESRRTVSARSRSDASRWKWVAGGAVVATAAMLATFWVGNQSQHTDERRDGNDWKTVATVAGQRVTVALPDGSSATLAPLSRLEYTTKSASIREVRLNGEAVFTVHPSSSTPLEVQAGDARIRVLGTTFGVRADSAVRVAVAEGRVSVTGKNSAILSAGDVAHLGDGEDMRIVRDTNVAGFISWTTGRLLFDRMPFAQVAQELERWYAVKVIVHNQIMLRQPVTISLQTDDPQGALELLRSVLDAQVIRRGETITFSPRERKL